MNAIDPYITVTISLLGVAYPILLQAVARLDDKYSSAHIVDLFRREKEYKCFKRCLIASLVFVVIWSFRYESIIQFDNCRLLNYLINHSATILMGITILLVVSFFYFVRKIVIYYTTKNFISYLKKKIKKKCKKNDCYLEALSDILLQSIQKRLPNKDLWKIWVENKLQGVISEQTYRDIWDILCVAVQYEQDDLIIEYWEIAYQHYTNNFCPNGIKKDTPEQKKFIEFHYILGGLLICKQRYSCIRRIFAYTTSEPLGSVLLPTVMQDIFTFYFDVREQYPHTSGQYPFPQESGLQADAVVKNWICSYMAILFLRQYTIPSLLITIKPLEDPIPPKTQGEIRTWIDGLDGFKKLVNEHLDNAELMKILKWQIISREWCTQNDKPYPLDFIEEFKAKLESTYQNNALTMPLFMTKVEKFNNSSKNIIEKAMNSIMQISNTDNIDNADKWTSGKNILSCLISKDTFSECPESENPHFDTFLANSVVDKLRKDISDSFLDARKTRNKGKIEYLLVPEIIFKAIDKLNVDKQYVIVSFGMDVDKVPELKKENYNDIIIYAFERTSSVNNILFVLKKIDLPKITTLPPDNQKRKYSLEKISEDFELYASVIDLNEAKGTILEDARKQGKTDDEIKKSALLNIFIDMEIKWKNGIEIIQIQQHTGKSKPDVLDDVKPINNKSSKRAPKNKNC
ncbi:MAG: hypothetical protein LBT48_00150 [Prevotellaceae bacterium]|jgi:hypothetical protein|nr:hypothetical protein [Prevotellaceae bacterium]